MAKPNKYRSLVKALKLSTLFLIPLALFAKLFLIYNYTPSVPVGWYVVYPCLPGNGDLALFDVPKPLQAMAYGRGYVPYGASILKPVVATKDDLVCVKNRIVSINSDVVAEALVTDSKGRALPVLNTCHTLGEGEIFVLATDWQNSFDGRYFGVISGENIDGCGRKIW